MKLQKHERLFFGCKIDSKIREALALAKPGDRKYFEDPNSEFLRVVAVDDERWIGKVMASGVQVSDVDDIQRNVVSILRRVSPTLRVPVSSIKIFSVIDDGSQATLPVPDAKELDVKDPEVEGDGPYIDY